ncbi:MAG: hypothetical protein JOZ53_20770 [Planctomycetaceae bacterium]|nr:hypothetical protein [Planctomycetaceae bacterium]
MHDVDLQPHRTRDWRTARLDPPFKQRAEKVSWCYANADRLARRRYWVVCVDEMPNHQVLVRVRAPRHRQPPVVLFFHSGRMRAVCVEAKDAAHYTAELKGFRRRHRYLRGVYLIQDGDPSHTAGATRDNFRSRRGWWRPRFTPAHVS